VSPVASRKPTYHAGERIRCTNATGGRDGLACTHYVSSVPPHTISTARRIRTWAEGEPGSNIVQCKYCKALTEVVSERVTAAA
jgi:hypothetical protein